MGEEGVEGGAEFKSNMDCCVRRWRFGLGLSSICTTGVSKEKKNKDRQRRMRIEK